MTASGWPDVHGSRSATAATAPATAPRTAVVAAVRVDGALAVPARRDERDAAARAAFFRVAVAVRVPAVCIFAFFFFPLVFFPFFGALVLTTGADFALRSAERLVFVAERLLAADRALSRERAAVA